MILSFDEATGLPVLLELLSTTEEILPSFPSLGVQISKSGPKNETLSSAKDVATSLKRRSVLFVLAFFDVRSSVYKENKKQQI